MAKSSTKWYPYPQEKPHYEGDYSVYLIDEGVALYKSGKFVNCKDETDIEGTVIAWAEEA